MRFGVKFLALTGLCGLALTCLMGLAEDSPAPEMMGEDFLPIPPAHSDPASHQPPVKYSRNRKPEPPMTDAFSGFAPAEQAGSAPAPPIPAIPPMPSKSAEPSADNPPFFPLGTELPTAPARELAADLEHPEHQTSEFAPLPSRPTRPEQTLPVIRPVPVQELPTAKREPAPLPSTATLFPDESEPTPAAKVSEFNPLESSPAPLKNAPQAVTVPAMLAKPAKPAAEPFPKISIEPSTGPQTAVVSLEWVKRTEVNVGQECECDLIVKNAGEIPANNVSVLARFPATSRLLPTTMPAPTPEGGQLKWLLGDLAPKQAKTIRVHMIPTARGELNASAFVHFTSAAATAFRVQEPLLEVVLQGPKEVQLGDPASQIIQVSNPGTGTAQNVEIKALIPAGLEHPQGKQLTMAIGSLNPGETRMVRLALSAVQGGKQHIKVLAEAKLSSEAAPYLRKLTESEIQIISPSVKVVVDGPGLRYKNRNASYHLSVTNDGTAVSNNVRVMHKVPEGFEFISATEGGKFDALSQTVTWFVGRIEPGQSSTMSITLEAVKLGDFVQEVSAITDQGASSEARVSTKVEGIASLALEVKDVNDPVEIGVETAYEIHVKNQGTKHAQNVAVACELPAGVELVSVKAPTQHQMQGRVVVFQALPALDAEKSAIYRIIVRGKTDGYQRFRARLASDSIQEPLIVEELTKFYGE